MTPAGLAAIRQEAGCADVVTVRAGVPYASVVVCHGDVEITVLHASLSRAAQEVRLRRVIHDWLVELHDGQGVPG